MPRSSDSLPSPPGRGETLLVHGNGGLAVALWAAGLARQRDPSFAWADLAPAPPGLDKVVRLLMARSSDGAWINGVSGDDVRPPTVSTASVSRLLRDPANPSGMPPRLAKYLGLPALVQMLAARATRPDGRATILVLGLETLPSAQLEATFGSDEVHQTLRREGISCIAAFDGIPPGDVLALFDEVFHVTAPSAQEWSRSVVQGTRGHLPEQLARPRGFTDQWKALGLPTALLSLWSMPGFFPVRPR